MRSGKKNNINQTAPEDGKENKHDNNAICNRLRNKDSIDSASWYWNPGRPAVGNVIRLIIDRTRKLYCRYGIPRCVPATGELETEIDWRGSETERL